MRIELNGREVELADGASARDAALSLDVDPAARGLAVAVDGEVVPRGDLDSLTLREGQRVEVVIAIQGGGR